MDTALIESLGLPEKSAKIYLATLTLGTASIQDIAHHAQLKRPTVYVHIEELLQQGLLEKIPIGKKEYYRACDPQLLQERVEQHVQTIQHALPELQALRLATKGRPSVSVLEGEKGLQQVYSEIAQANAIRFWSDLTLFEKRFAHAFDLLSTSIKTNEIRTREIIANTPEAKYSSKRYALKAGKSYSSRIAMDGDIKNDSAIYGDVVALFRIHDFNLFVIRIEDPTIATTMKTLFDMAWNSATPCIGRK